MSNLINVSLWVSPEKRQQVKDLARLNRFDNGSDVMREGIALMWERYGAAARYAAAAAAEAERLAGGEEHGSG